MGIKNSGYMGKEMDMYLDKRTYKIFNSIFGRIIMSLIYITPTIYILNGIITENYDKFLYLELLQIICLILFTLNWVNYFNWRRKYKKEEKLSDQFSCPMIYFEMEACYEYQKARIY